MQRIPLSNGGFATVDDEDVDLVRGHTWYARHEGKTAYAAMSVTITRNGTRKVKTVRMHRLILNAPAGSEVDHRDGNGLNNTRANIRLCSHADNMRNCRKSTKNTSGIKGVHFERCTGKWLVRIRAAGKYLNLGRFKSASEAAEAYRRASIKYHGEFGRLG